MKISWFVWIPSFVDIFCFFSLFWRCFLLKSAVSFNWKRECNVKTPMEKIMKYVKHWHGFYYYLLLNFLIIYATTCTIHLFVHSYVRSFVRLFSHSFRIIWLSHVNWCGTRSLQYHTISMMCELCCVKECLKSHTRRIPSHEQLTNSCANTNSIFAQTKHEYHTH